MLVPFNSLPDTSRIWIYQANRKFTEEETREIEEALGHFIEEWTSHGRGLKAGYDLKYNRFIIIALDQSAAAASGCSIDASVHFVQSLEQKYGVDLLDKMNVTFKQGEYVTHKSLTDFKKMAKDKAVSSSTIVFNNLVTNISEYKDHWEVPASESWHSRFM